MKITFTPQMRFDQLELSKCGDMLVINGEKFDFAPLPEKFSVPVKSNWIIGPVKRVDGELQMVVACPGILDNVVIQPEDGDIGVPSDE